MKTENEWWEIIQRNGAKVAITTTVEIKQIQADALKWAVEQVETSESQNIARERIMRKINDVAAQPNEKS